MIAAFLDARPRPQAKWSFSSQHCKNSACKNSACFRPRWVLYYRHILGFYNSRL